MSLQLKGLTIAGLILAAGAFVLFFFFKEMSTSSLMSASPKYGPNYPTVPAAVITEAPQCLAGYDKPWIGCQKLGQ